MVLLIGTDLGTTSFSFIVGGSVASVSVLFRTTFPRSSNAYLASTTGSECSYRTLQDAKQPWETLRRLPCKAADSTGAKLSFLKLGILRPSIGIIGVVIRHYFDLICVYSPEEQINTGAISGQGNQVQ